MIKYKAINKGKWKWELTSEYTYSTDKYIPPLITKYIEVRVCATSNCRSSHIILDKGYAINGVNFSPDLKCLMRAGFVHDALWQLVQELKLPKRMVKTADKIFRDILQVDSNWLVANLRYTGVRIGAKFRFGWRY